MIKSFRSWLESVETGGSFVGITGMYINPDQFWQRAFDETFVFCDNKLYTYEMSPELDRVCTHHEFFYHIPELKKKIAEHLKKDIDDVGMIDAANYRIGQSEKDCLIGRFFTIKFADLFSDFLHSYKKFDDYGYNGEVKVVSFWNKNVDIYNKQLKPCMVALQKYEEIGRAHV